MSIQGICAIDIRHHILPFNTILMICKIYLYKELFLCLLFYFIQKVKFHSYSLFPYEKNKGHQLVAKQIFFFQSCDKSTLAPDNMFKSIVLII